MKVLKKCRICNHKKFDVILSYQRLGIDGVYVDKINDDYKKEDLTLLRCQNCGFFQLKQIVDPKLYQNYKFESANTKTILDWTKKISKQLINSYQLADKRIIEVGAGDGSFLENLKNGNEVIAVEPSKNQVYKLQEKGIKVIPGFFDENIANNFCKKFDFIVVRHVLEHIDELKKFCKNIICLAKPDGHIYLELPYVNDIISQRNYLNFFYEHVNYFSIEDVKKLFNRYGFGICDFGFNKINNGSFFVILKKQKKNKLIKDKLIKKEIKRFIDGFSSYVKKLEKLKERLRDKTGVGYGAANKSWSVLNLGEFSKNEIKVILDKNKNLKNKHLSGLNIQIKKPEFIKQINPDYVIVFATAYYKEVVSDLKAQGYNGKIINIAKV
jgi:SAM-dependent methyltransferase